MQLSTSKGFRRLVGCILPFVVVLIAACSDNPTGVEPGRLSVAVSGLPDGAAKVRITGPNGFVRELGRSEILTKLADGLYVVSPADVEIDGVFWAGSPGTQSIDVKAGTEKSATPINYALQPPSLSLEVEGLSDTPGEIVITGPDGSVRRPVTSELFINLVPGTYTITATSRTVNGVTHDPMPATQSVQLQVGRRTQAKVRYAGLNFSFAGLYVTQSIQTFNGVVPLLQGRDGILRVFVVADRPNNARPALRVRIYLWDTLVQTEILSPLATDVPLTPDERSMETSWSLRLPGSLIQPGMSLLADVDPENLYQELSETDNSFSTTGRLDIRTATPFKVRLVPVHFTVNNTVGDVNAGNMDSYLTDTKAMWPLPSLDADVSSVFSYDGEPASFSLLNALLMKRTVEGSDRHYLGIVSAQSRSGSYASLGGTVGVAGDNPERRAQTVAHEWGHNWGRLHSPCGVSATNFFDFDYPYPDGTVGNFGMHVDSGVIKGPLRNDIMGYCTSTWVSVYNYWGVMAYRETHSPSNTVLHGASTLSQPVMIVWGRVVNGVAMLEPSFLLNAPAAIPDTPGPYSIEATDTMGATVFRYSFNGVQVADSPVDEHHFAFAIPVEAAAAHGIGTLRLRIRGQEAAIAVAPALSRSAAPAATASPLVSRVGGDQLAFRWDAGEHPAALIRDARTGEVLSFARSGQAVLHSQASELDIHLSNGITSVGRRMRAPPQ